MTPPSTREAAPRRVDGSMSLLNDMMANTLDEAYVERAARKAGQLHDPAPPPRRGSTTVVRRAVAVLVLVALGVVTGTAVAQVRARQQATSGLRADLAQEVQERSARSDALAGQAEELRAQVAAAEAALLNVDAQGRRIADRLAELGLAAGTVPVEGEGLRVTLDDPAQEAAAEPDPLRGGSEVDRRVQDRDLQALTNALWAAGAEAISVNGHRLTALTAIRSAGDAILVDFALLSPPYVVEAIGDPAELEIDLLDGPVGRSLTTYVGAYGLTFGVRRDGSLSLPGAGTPELIFVREPGEPAP